MTLLGEDATPKLLAMVEISALLLPEGQGQSQLLPEVQAILDKFAPVFAAPSSLPRRRKYDHSIPLIPGATPISIRPYRVAPALKDEMERQVQEKLESGIIRHNNSAFSSPMILVQKKDKT